MKNLMIMFVALVLCGSVFASDFTTWFQGSDKGVATRVGYKFSAQTEAGIEGQYLKDMGEADNGAFAGSVYALWYVAPKIDMPLRGWIPTSPSWIPLPETIPVGMYLGTKIGATENSDAIAGILAGIQINPEDRVSIGIEGQYNFDKSSWRELSSITSDDRWSLVIGPRIKF